MSYSLAGLTGYYSLHGIHIEVRWDDASVAKAIDAILNYFGLIRREGASRQRPVQLAFLTQEPPPTLPDNAHWVVQHNGIEVWRADHSFYLRESGSIMQLDAAAGTGWGIIQSPLWRQPSLVRLETINLVIHSLLILLRHRALYPLHAAALTREGNGVLLVAQSDSGKSTQALSLVRQGWGYLSDDSLLLRPVGEGVEARPLRRDFGVDQEAVHDFPEIAAHWQPYLTDERKRRIDMEAVYPGQRVERGLPRVLVFPKIVPRLESKLNPIGKKEALFRLMRQSGFLALEPRISAAHLDVLKRLVNQADGYELLAGRDMKREPALVAPMLARILPAPCVDEPPLAAIHE